MFNIFRHFSFNYVCLCSTLASFSISTLPVYGSNYISNEMNINDIAFALKMEKLIEKINKYVNKSDAKKLLETAFEVKREVQAYFGIDVNVDNVLENIEYDFIKLGGNKKYLKSFKKKVKNMINGKSINSHSWQIVWLMV